ncbi:winged helix-turn-helix domain-containing protein [Streptomyces sp. NPDC059861]|uniref:winged helix-turn-helix domain-containing protein n=1 Tax=Streptomyces sp. NPDC059861 TaxID=3346974 RepID=UPI00365E47D7
MSPQEVADELRDRIRSGTLKAGQRMPTQAALVEEFGVERGAVRQALRILQSEDLLTNVSRGAPATVAPDGATAFFGPTAQPESTLAALPARMAAAFEAKHVRIDALCLTSASLNLAVSEPLRRLHTGVPKPATVHLRVLLPSRDIDLAFPPSVGSDGDSPAHRRALRNAQGLVLSHNLMALRSTHGVDVRVHFRALPFTPPVKLYLLNETEALFAFYTPSRRAERTDGGGPDTYEVQGGASPLFAFRQGDGGVRDKSFVEQSRLWFDRLWETISTELDLAG